MGQVAKPDPKARATPGSAPTLELSGAKLALQGHQRRLGEPLVAQLRALDEENVEERTRLEGETAEVLRKLDKAPQSPK